MSNTKINFKVKFILFFSAVILIIGLFTLPANVYARDGDICAIYFTGVGCPHCAKTDSVLLEQLMDQYPNLLIIEYEIYQQQENSSLLYLYDEQYDSGLGVPLIIFNEDESLKGDIPILDNINNVLNSKKNNKCLLVNGSSVDFSLLDIVNLPGSPKLWHQNKILMKVEEGSSDSKLLRDLLVGSDLDIVLGDKNFTEVDPIKVPLSGKNVKFEQAIKIDNWLFQWNGDKIGLDPKEAMAADVDDSEVGDLAIDNGENDNLSVETEETDNFELTWAKIISLAAVDAVNPCALAVLVLMLTAILAYNPSNRKNIILAGLAFIISIFVMYLIYGLVIIKFFQVVQALTAVRLWLYKILGVIAIILAILNIRDFFKYKPGNVGTEMPLFMRPKVQKIIGGITSPKGAFGVGIFVTLFLLPCTIGPYIIAGGILSAMEMLQTLPPLLLYNLIFVAPMLIIVGVVYLGFKKVDDISAWKEKNITRLHLVAGLIMLVLGVAMILGWV
jgi:hypothetical protein